MNQGRRNRGVRATKQGIEILQKRRHSKGWTLQKLANKAGVALDTVKRLVRCVRNVDRESVEKIVYALDLSPTDLIDSNVWNPPNSGLAGYARICISDRGNRFSWNHELEPSFDLAQQLGSELEAVGHSVFIAGEEIRQPANWFERFTEELEQCDCYVLLLSPQAAISEVITEEIRYVWELYHAQKKPIILSIQIEANVVLQPDVRDYLAKFQSRKWTSANDTPAIVEAILNTLANPEKSLIEEDSRFTLQNRDKVISPLISTELEHPTGQVPLASTFYIERPPIEAQCYQEIVHSGALIRIKAPRQMGKTSLMARILDQARKQDYRTVHLSFQLATSDVLSNVDKLMRWFCLHVGQRFGSPSQLVDYWDDIFDGNYNSTNYFEQYLLATNSPLVIGLDEVDRVFAYPEVANDFFGLLRAWHERSRYGDQDSEIWQKLRLIVIHSTEVYIPMNLNQSPFNVGLSIELPEFTIEQVQDLTQRYQLDWTLDQIEALMRLVGGHPYLVRLAMYHVAHQAIASKQVLKQAATEAGIYSDHLRRLLWNLEQYPELANAFHNVVTAKTPVSLKSILAFKLNSLGLVAIASNHVTPRCELYRQYFCERLVIDEIE